MLRPSKEVHTLRMTYNIRFRNIKNPVARELLILREIDRYYDKQAEDKRSVERNPRLDA